MINMKKSFPKYITLRHEELTLALLFLVQWDKCNLEEMVPLDWTLLTYSLHRHRGWEVIRQQ